MQFKTSTSMRYVFMGMFPRHMSFFVISLLVVYLRYSQTNFLILFVKLLSILTSKRDWSIKPLRVILYTMQELNNTMNAYCSQANFLSKPCFVSRKDYYFIENCFQLKFGGKRKCNQRAISNFQEKIYIPSCIRQLINSCFYFFLIFETAKALRYGKKRRR